MRPDLDVVAGEFAGYVDVVSVDVSLEPEVAQSMAARATPTLIGVRDGSEVVRHTGRLTRAELGDLFQSVADGEPVAWLGRRDLFLRETTGLALVVAGVFAGPAWPLVLIGGIIMALSFVPNLRIRRDRVS